MIDYTTVEVGNKLFTLDTTNWRLVEKDLPKHTNPNEFLEVLYKQYDVEQKKSAIIEDRVYLCLHSDFKGFVSIYLFLWVLHCAVLLVVLYVEFTWWQKTYREKFVLYCAEL